MSATYAQYYNTRKRFDEDADMSGTEPHYLAHPVNTSYEQPGSLGLSRNIELSRALAIELENSSASHAHPASVISDSTIILALDTNCLISHLPLLQKLLDKCAACSETLLVFLVPLICIRELDGLKLSQSMASQAGKRRGVTVGTLAQQANKWILQMLEERSGIFRAQRKGETPAQLGHSSTVSLCFVYTTAMLIYEQADDLVLDAALFWSLQRPAMVGVVTNDNNLRISALAHGVPSLPIKPDMDVSSFVSSINPTFATRLGLKPSPIIPELDLPAPVTPPMAYTHTHDMEIERTPPPSYSQHSLSPATANQFLDSVARTLSSILPPAIYSHFSAATDEFTTAHLLRSYPAPNAWSAKVSLEILNKYFSSLEQLWTAPPDSSASRWASPSKQPNNLRMVRASLNDLYIAFGGRGEGKSSYALKKVQQWDRGCWMGFVYDLEVLCMKGNLLGPEGNVVESWREAVKGFSK